MQLGQGVLRYFTKGPTNPGGRLEVKGWAIDKNDNLIFNGTSLQACPSTDGSWPIWLASVDKPAGQEGCLSFTGRTITTTKPVKCTYSDYVA